MTSGIVVITPPAAASTRDATPGIPLSRAPAPTSAGRLDRRSLRLDQCLGLAPRRFVHAPAGHRLDHQFAERPDKRVTSIGREPCRGAVEIGGEGAHLIFQCREGADVMNPALFV